MKNSAKAAVLCVCAFILLFSFASCSTEPYPYELESYVTVPLSSLETTVKQSLIEDTVKSKIAEIRENAAIREKVVNRESREGDLINISFSCYYADTYSEDKENGNPIKNISDSNCLIKIGGGKYPFELENALLGRYENDEFTVRLTLPVNFTVDDLAGTPVVYEVKVISVTALQLPLYNDAFVQSVSACDTVEQYEEMMHRRVKEEIIWDRLLQISTVLVYPFKEVNNYSVNFVTYYTNLANAASVTLEEYVAKKFFIDLEEFHLQADEYAKELVKEELVLYSLVRTYDLEITDSEYNEGAEYYVKEYGLDSVSALEGRFGSTYVRQTVQMDKVLEYLASLLVVDEDVGSDF